MEILLNIDRIREEVRMKSHLQVQNVDNPVVRDNSRADLVKMDEIDADIQSSKVELDALCGRFLTYSRMSEADNALALPQMYVYDLSMSERRASNKAQPLADAMSAFLVHNSLSKFYVSVSQPDLAKTESSLAAVQAQLINQLLFTKAAPIPRYDI